MLETSARLLRLLSLLQTPREWPGAELAERLGVSARTVRRDVDRLRELGYEVEATAGAPGYRLGAGTGLPPLLLDDEEAVAVAIGLRAAAGGSAAGVEEASLRALTKLEQVLPAALRRRLATLRSMTVPMSSTAPAVNPETLTAIAAACRDHESLRLDYRSGNGSATERIVEPHRLIHSGRHWYLLAWDPGKTDWRTFRVDRLRLRTPNGPRFTPRESPHTDLARYLSERISSAPYRYQASFTLYAPAATIADRLPPTIAVVEPLTHDTCAVRCGSNSLDELALWMALLGPRFDVHEPPELVEHLASLAQRLTQATAAASVLEQQPNGRRR